MQRIFGEYISLRIRDAR